MTKYDVLCLYKTKDIAMDILKHMEDLARSCGYVTANQYLEMSGIDECVEGGNEWGWYAKTIKDTVGVKTRYGWILDLGNPYLVAEKPKNGRHTQADFLARQILADLAGRTVNDTTNSLTAKIIFGNDQNPQKEFHYRNLTEVAILIDHAQKSIQKYVDHSNLNELKAARDILITAISSIEIENMEDEESEEK